MKKSLKEIWNNRNQILEGITNAIIRDEYVEAVSRVRMNVCEVCPSKGTKCAVPGTAPCCDECGCSLTFKTRSLSTECPLNKWSAVMTEEEENKLDELN